NTFTTSTPPDTTPPVISAIQASGITTSSATISWTTNEAANTQIQYGATISYGSTTTLNASMVTSHSQSISSLSSSTLYHYRVLSRDAAGNLSTSSDNTFTTSTPPDTTPPTIPVNVQASAISTSQVNLNWNPSTDNTAVTGYKIFRNSTQIATTSGISYQDSGLSQATTYTYSVKAYDGAGNESDYSNTASATTDQILLPNINVSEVLLGEDFAAGIPASWLSEGGWRTDNSCGKTIGHPFVAPFAIADSSCINTGSDKLTTSSFDAASCSSVKLSFSNQYNWYSGNFDVDVSSDGGSTWTNNIRVSADDGYPTPNWKDIDISAIAGSQNGKIKFKYSNTTTDGYWALDNVWVTCETNQFQFSAQIQTQSSKTVMITNTGTSELTINMINIAGQDASDYSIGETDDCSNQTLLPGETCTVDVVFTPASAGLKSASLSINSNDPDAPESNIPLAGTGEILISPAPKIKLNGSSGHVVIMRGDNSPVTIALDSGSYNGTDGDWWLLVEYRKRWYYYDISTGNWKRGFSFYKQAPLEDIGPIEVTNGSRMSQGRYVYYFGVDTSMNDVQDSNGYYYDTLTVDVE
ncbi:MAG: choice-of-anchor D domain-containing protein, partial [Nitrospirae bacterium]|nr:choice-of-anchor D domain-containing protein [Nitrospirota bacterium]